MATPTVGGSKDEIATRLAAPALVFVGAWVSWPSRPSDLTHNTQLAEKWESEFPRWEIVERQFRLSDAPNSYFVELSDGMARFMIQTGTGYDKATRHVVEVASRLQERDLLTRANIQVELQYLWAATTPFQERVDDVSSKVLNHAFPSVLSGKLYDFAYLADFEIDQVPCQLSLGVVRRSEVPMRLRVPVPNAPEVGTFCSVVRRKSLRSTTLAIIVESSREIGRKIVAELGSNHEQ